MTISSYNRDFIAARCADHARSRIHVIHCGVDLRYFVPAPNGKKGNTILCVARLDRQKGLDCLIRACALLAEQGTDFQCVIAGDGPERGSLEHLIAELGLSERVVLLGSKTQDQVRELLLKAAIKVLPSRSEGIPVALMEAMALKVPIISTRIMGIPELIEDGVSGFLVPSDDVDALADRMHTLLTDEKMRHRFAENGYAKVSRDFNLKTETDKLMALWSS